MPRPSTLHPGTQIAGATLLRRLDTHYWIAQCPQCGGEFRLHAGNARQGRARTTCGCKWTPADPRPDYPVPTVERGHYGNGPLVWRKVCWEHTGPDRKVLRVVGHFESEEAAHA